MKIINKKIYTDKLNKCVKISDYSTEKFILSKAKHFPIINIIL
jgi:hypothetical protein